MFGKSFINVHGDRMSQIKLKQKVILLYYFAMFAMIKVLLID